MGENSDPAPYLQPQSTFAPTLLRRLLPIGGIMDSTGRPMWSLFLCRGVLLLKRHSVG
jgi:hypothetical protein